VEKAVVGLNLCPFANAVLKKGRLHIQVSKATEPLALLEDLRTELKRLLDAPETEIETSLLVCPRMLSDFLEFNDFLDMAEALLTELDLNGTVQIASFHPHYQFAGTAVDDAAKACGVTEGGVTDDALTEMIRAVLEANRDVVDVIRSGKDTKGKKMKFLQGLVMKEAKGQANPAELPDRIAKLLEGL